MNSPPQQPPAPPHPESQFPPFLDEPSSATAFDWANLLDFTLEDQFNILWTPDTHPVDTPSIPSLDSVSEASNRGSDSSDKIRKRDPRLTCENFLAGRIPCSCPEVDEMNEVEQVQVEKKQRRKMTAAAGGGVIRCQVPECEVDISGLKGYHKRHRICLSCAHASSVVLDGEAKRFCQQCGKFHILPDFDEGRRSCRRKLAWHNRRRRRKPAESKGTLDKETQVDQLAEYFACEDNAGKDATLNESEDGNVSPLNSNPDSQITQNVSDKSFATIGETQMEGGKDDPKCSPLEDNKTTYSSVCPTGRISFKLYDWNPAEFPRRLRHQIFQWLASMPVELEGYIRPGCTILTAFIAMPNFMWEKLSDDAAQHIHNFVNAPESLLFGRGSMTVYLNDTVYSVLKGATTLVNNKSEALPPRLHYVHPSCFESGKPMEFVACGSNFLQSRFRFLVSFAGQYLAYDDFHVVPYYGNKEDNAKCLEHQIYKIYISCTDPTLTGPAFIEVENEFGISNFIPVLFADKHMCSEMKLVEQRLNGGRFLTKIQRVSLDAITEPCKNFVTRQATISELLLDIGWLLKDPKFADKQNHFTSTHLQRVTCLLHFLIHNKFTIVLERILHSLNNVMGAKNFSTHDNVNNDADVRLFNKSVEHARQIIKQRHQDLEGLVSCIGSSVEKADYWSNCHRENHTYSAVRSTNEDMKVAKNSLGAVIKDFQQSDEAAPLINKEVVMNLTYEPHPGKARPQRTYSRFLPTTIMSSRPLFLMVAVSVVCFGVCAVVLHPDKVGKVAVSIHRCLFGNSKP